MGQEVNHQVQDRMLVSRFTEEAGAIFGLDPEFTILMLCTTSPEVLDKCATMAGPPRVFPNTSVYDYILLGPDHKKTTFFGCSKKEQTLDK